MRWCSVRLLLVAMLATQHTDFESFANALGAIPNQPPVPMACEPSPSPIDVDTKDIVRQVIDVLLKHSPSPAMLFKTTRSSPDPQALERGATIGVRSEGPTSRSRAVTFFSH
jgi:hypothetical protein